MLVIGLLTGLYLVSRQTNLFSRADISTAPQEVKISNISDNSFTVSWLTGKPTTGFIKYGSPALEETAQDDRDLGSQEFRVTHHVTIKNLEPGKTYYYQIFSGQEVFDDQGKPFTQTTAPTTENPPAVPEPVFGTVNKKDNTKATEALVYLEINGGSLLSSYVRENGNWLITLNNARIKDLSDYISVDEAGLMNLEVKAGGEAKINLSARVKEKEAFSKIVLPAEEEDKTLKDRNGDGVINAIDYILMLLKV